MEWQKVKEYRKAVSERRFSLKLKENRVFGGKMHKEVKILFESDIKEKKRINMSIML